MICGPKITVIVPVYNVERYIGQCLESIIRQTYENLEILCIDDKSCDSSREIIKDFCVVDRRVRLITHCYNKGVALARNEGIEKASGEYIYFLDSDDWIRPEALEQLVEKMQVENADIAIGGIEAFNDEDDRCLIAVANAINVAFALNDIPKQVTRENFKFALEVIPSIACGKLYKKEFLVRNNIYFINKNVRHEDEGFHVKCMACNPRLLVVADSKYRYRIRRNSTMHFNDGLINTSVLDTKAVVLDALDYLSGTEVIYIDAVKDHYCKCFLYEKYGIVFYWGGVYFKIIRFGFVEVLKYLSNNRGKRLKVLGISIWKKGRKTCI